MNICSMDKILRVRVPEHIHTIISNLAYTSGFTMSEIVRLCIVYTLDKLDLNKKQLRFKNEFRTKGFSLDNIP